MSTFSVVGSGGFLGSALVSRLRDAGHHVLEWPRGRLSEATDRLGHVIYAAGVTGDFGDRPFDTVEAHSMGLDHWLRQPSVESFLYLSSTRVYRRAASTREEANLTFLSSDASSLYEQSKALGETLCFSADCNFPVRIARVSNVVGPRMPLLGGGSVAQLIHAASRGAVELRSAPSTAKDFVHLDDILEALPWLCLNGSASVYNLASGTPVTLGDWLDWLADRFSFELLVDPSAQDDSEPVVDTRRISGEFGPLMRSIWNEVSIE